MDYNLLLAQVTRGNEVPVGTIVTIFILVVVLILIMVIGLLVAQVLGLWFQAFMSNANVSMFDLDRHAVSGRWTLATSC